ncbi:hypothetical protein M1413_03175 [Patescibacteria group bacterium]|jgi:hypothetical protein|nr:hypothetical protein [Patescibacteria group bacterium]MCL5114194.1 hypothetical protein [Patescibacteria group bacterium]
MPTWFDIVKAEVDSVDEKNLFEPLAEIEDGDHEIGEADMDLKRLYSLAIKWQKSSMELMVAAQYVNNREDQEYKIKKAKELGQKSKLLVEIFWTSIKEMYNVWHKPSIGIRKGWKIVWSEPVEPPIPGFLKDLFGF